MGMIQKKGKYASEKRAHLGIKGKGADFIILPLLVEHGTEIKVSL